MWKVKVKMSILEMLLFEQNNPKFKQTGSIQPIHSGLRTLRSVPV
jgi:hypothetical protein